MIRMVDDTVSQWDCGRYVVYYQGDELLLKATNNKDAEIEGAALLKELIEEAGVE